MERNRTHHNVTSTTVDPSRHMVRGPDDRSRTSRLLANWAPPPTAAPDPADAPPQATTGAAPNGPDASSSGGKRARVFPNPAEGVGRLGPTRRVWGAVLIAAAIVGQALFWWRVGIPGPEDGWGCFAVGCKDDYPQILHQVVVAVGVGVASLIALIVGVVLVLKGDRLDVVGQGSINPLQ